MKQNRNVDRNVDRKRQIHRNSKTHIRTVGEAVEKQSSHSLVPIQTNVNNALSTPMQRNIKNNIKTITERANVLNNNTAPLPEIVSASNVGAYVNQIDIIRSIINLESITSNISQNFTFIDGGGSGDKIIINNIWKDDNNEYADKEWVLEQIANVGGGGGVNLSDYIKFGENTSLSTVIIKSPDNNDNNLQMNNHTFMLNRANNLNLKLTLDEASHEARIFTGNTLYLRAETLKFNTANDSIMFHYDYQTCEMRSNDFTFRTNVDNKELLKINDNTITYKGQPIIGTGGGSVDLTSYIHMGSNVVTTPIQLMTDTNTNTNENIYITGNSIQYRTNKAVDGQWTIRGHVMDIPPDIPRDGTYFNLTAPRMMFSIYKEFIITNYDNTETILRVNNDTITWKGQSLIGTGGGSADLSNYIQFGTNIASSSTADVSISYNNNVISITPQELEINDGSGNYTYITNKSIDMYADSNKSWEIYVNPSNKGMNIKTSTLTVESPEVKFHGNTFGIYNGTKLYSTCEITDDSFIIDSATLIMQLGSGTKFLQIDDSVFEWNYDAVLHEGTNTNINSVKLYANANNTGKCLELKPDGVTITSQNSSQLSVSVSTLSINSDFSEYDFQLSTKLFTFNLSNNFNVNLPNNTATFDATDFNVKTPSFKISYDTNDKSTTIFEVNDDTVTYKGQPLVNEDLSTYIHSGENRTNDDIIIKDESYDVNLVLNCHSIKLNSGTLYCNIYTDEFPRFVIQSNSQFCIHSPTFKCFPGGGMEGISFDATKCETYIKNFIIKDPDALTEIFNVTNDTITYKGQPIIKTGGGSVDLSNYIHGGNNTNISDITVYRTNADTVNGAYYSISPNGLTFHPSYGNIFSIICNDSMEIKTQNRALNIYFNTVNIASSSNGNISLISNSFGANTKYSINLTTTGIVSIFNNEFLLTKNTQNDSSNPYFKVTPDTIEWNKQPILVDTSNFVRLGTNNIGTNHIELLDGENHLAWVDSNGIKIFKTSVASGDFGGAYIDYGAPTFFYLKYNDGMRIESNDFEIDHISADNMMRVPVLSSRNDGTITLGGQSIILNSNEYVKIVNKSQTNNENVFRIVNDRFSTTLKYDGLYVSFNKEDNKGFIRYTHKEEGGDIVTSMYGDHLKFFYNYLTIYTNPDVISQQLLFYLDSNTITYKGQSLLVDTNNFIVSGENTNKSVTFKGSNNNYVTIDSDVIEIARTTTSSIFKIAYTTSNDTATCNMNINNMSCNVNSLLFINCRDNLQIRCGTAFVLNASTADGVRLSTIPDFIINGTVSFNFNMNDDTNSIRFTQNQVDGNYNKKNFGFVRSGENDGRIYVFYSERDSAVNRFSIRNFDEINFILSNATNAHDPGTESHTWSFKTDNLYYGVNPYVSKSFTVTHISPIDENYTYDDFTIGSPVYMSGKVYVKDYENKIWKLSTRNDTIDCISSIKPTGTLKEYLGICVSKETDEITFASHGDFLVKVGDSSKYEIGDIIYINDNMDISILDENTPLTAKINKSIIGTITSIIDSEFVAVFRD